MIPDSRDYYDDLYDDHQLYEEKLSKIDGSMIALSPDGQNLAIFDPRKMKIVASPSETFKNLDVEDFIAKDHAARNSIDKDQSEVNDILSESSNEVRINVVEITDNRIKNNEIRERSDEQVEINFQKSFYNLRDYINESDIRKKVEFVSSLKGWSIAISDKYYCPKTKQYDNLIALSRIEKADVEDAAGRNVRGYVIVFSESSMNSLFDPKGELIRIGFGGVVDLFSMDNDIILCIKNRHGIHRHLLSCDGTGKLLMKELEKLYYPERMKNFSDEQSFLDYIRKASTTNYLLVDSVKSYQYEPFELYDLKTNGLINTFTKPKEKLNLTGSILSVSNNCKLLAYAPCNDAIFIYSVESGILICKKSFDPDTEIQVLHFFDNDERLFILGKGILCIWNILCSSNEIINIEETEFENELEPYKFFKTLSFIAKSNSTEGIIAVADTITKRPAIRKLMSYIRCSQKIDDFTRIIENFIQVEIGDINLPRTPRHPGRVLLKSNGKSYLLQKNPMVVLSIGSNTVQVWRASGELWVLEYIWTSEKNLFVKTLDVGLRKFSLVLTNQDPTNKKSAKKIKNERFKEINIKVPNSKGMVKVVKHACQSLEYLYKRKDIFLNDELIMEFYNEVVNQTINIVYKFIKEYPVQWMFMDIRYNVMANLIRARSLDLICLILFNDDEKINISEDDLSKLFHFNEQALILHRPQISRWSKPEIDEIYVEENDLEVALQCYEENITDKTNHDLIIFACLWEYYLRNATDHIGWMISITKVLPRLIELKLDSYYIEGLLYKPCFQLNKVNIPCIHFRKLRNASNILCVALPLTELPTRSTSSEYKQLSKNELYQVNILPVVNFTVNTNYCELSLFKKIMYTFLPRNYLNHKKKNNSPFIELIGKKNFDTSFYANPIMEVVLEWKWRSARKHYLVSFVLYILHLLSFSVVSYSYTAHLELVGIYQYLFLFTLFVSYYTSSFFFITELKQLNHYGYKPYLMDLFNWFDLLAASLPFISLNIIVKDSFKYADGFKDITSSTGVVILFSFIILLLWVELLLLLRVFLGPSQYIYIFINIIGKTWPILFFNLVMVIGFAHSFYILLGFSQYIHLSPSPRQYLFNNVTITEEAPDNLFSKPVSLAVQSVFWDNLPFDEFDFWPVRVLSSLGSLTIILIMQNMLIALMNGAYEEAEAKAKLGVLRFRSKLISDFESLEQSPWIPVPKQPKYFCFIDNPGILTKWKKISDRRKNDKVFSLFSESINIPDKIDDLKPLWTWDDKEIRKTVHNI